MEGFEGLTSGFGMDDFDKKVEEVKTDIKQIESRKEIVKAKAENPVVFQDQEFIQKELKTLIVSARTVMYKVEQDIKIGAEPRQVEVYAKLVESIGKQYQALMDLNKSIFDAQVQKGEVDINNIGDNKISLTSSQLLDMINKANENSEMNRIDTDFEIENENIPEKRGDD